MQRRKPQTFRVLLKDYKEDIPAQVLCHVRQLPQPCVDASVLVIQ